MFPNPKCCPSNFCFLWFAPAGEIDLEMFSQLRLKHPEVTVDTEVVEPSAQQLHNYRGELFMLDKKKRRSKLKGYFFFYPEDHVSSCPRPFLIIIHPAILILPVPDSDPDVSKKKKKKYKEILLYEHHWIPRSTKSAAPWPVASHYYANPIIHTCRKPYSESTAARSKIPGPSFFLPVLCSGSTWAALWYFMVFHWCRVWVSLDFLSA